MQQPGTPSMTVVESPQVQRASRRFIKASLRAPLLGREDELVLARRWRDDGDVEALHALISAYTRLVIRPAMHYRRYGVPVSDLVQEGAVGLMLAAARFDPDRKTRFSTYASWWVRSAMQDFVLRNWSLVRTGTTAAQKALFFNFRRLRARIDEAHDARLSPEARQSIADELRVPLGDVETMEQRLAANDQSLNAPSSAEGDGEWQDLLPDTGPTPETIVAEMRDAETRARWLATALDELLPRERRIIAARRLGEECVTLEALGRKLGVSKERVRQLEQRAMKTLRRSIASQSGLGDGGALVDA